MCHQHLPSMQSIVLILTRARFRAIQCAHPKFFNNGFYCNTFTQEHCNESSSSIHSKSFKVILLGSHIWDHFQWETFLEMRGRGACAPHTHKSKHILNMLLPLLNLSALLSAILTSCTSSGAMGGLLIPLSIFIVKAKCLWQPFS